MIITGAIDVLLLQVEARREEAYMISTHGDVYRAYKRSVGRFLPRPRTR
jgi:protein-S-isoprenylcysteine O-methyltransferase Ste14